MKRKEQLEWRVMWPSGQLHHVVQSTRDIARDFVKAFPRGRVVRVSVKVIERRTK